MTAPTTCATPTPTPNPTTSPSTNPPATSSPTVSPTSPAPAASGATPPGSGAASPLTAAPEYAVIESTGTLSADQLAQLKAAGISRVVVQAVWADLQPAGPGGVDPGGLAAFTAAFDAVVAAGLVPVVEHALHLPPDWVKDSVEPFTDQHGTVLTGAATGADIRNWFATQTGRDAVGQFLPAVTAALGSDRVAAVDRVKFGGGTFGELQYPLGGSFWGFGPSMQTGAGLAADVTVCPVPGYVPRSGDDASDVAYVNWYLDVIVAWELFLLQGLKDAGWTCPLHVMCPSDGIRANQTRADDGWWTNAALGVDYTRVVAALKRDPQAAVWSTWINGPTPIVPPVVDTDQAAWASLWAVAALRGKAASLWGENTGGEGDSTPNSTGTGTSVDAVFANALAAGTPADGVPVLTGTSSLGPVGWTSYAGLMWLNAETLLDPGPQDATLAYLGQQIAARAGQTPNDPAASNAAPLVVPAVNGAGAQLVTAGSPTTRLELKGVAVWGIRDFITGDFAQSQYDNRDAVCATIASWGFNLIRLRVLADEYVHLTQMGSTATYLQWIRDWVASGKAHGLMVMPCWWDSLDSQDGEADAAWADAGGATYPMMTDVHAALALPDGSDDPAVFYEVFNEPNTVSTAQWIARMQDTIQLWRANGYQGLLVIDLNSWAHVYDDPSMTQLETFDAGLTGSGRHNLAFARHDYCNDYPNGFSLAEWVAATGGTSTAHVVIETEFGNYNGPGNQNDTWSAAICAAFATDLFDRPNIGGAIAFLFGNWYDANAMSTDPTGTSPTTWGTDVRELGQP